MRIIILVLMLGMIIGACSSNESEKLLSKITKGSKKYSIEDFTRFGFKIGEEYDSDELPYAQSVYWGFWKDIDAPEPSRIRSLGRNPGGMVEFEIRFYSSHKDAMNYGIKYADDATGENAVLIKHKSLWPEGIRNRRTSGGPDGSPLPKYGDYVVFANFIIICEGVSSKESFQNCTNFLKNLE